MRIVSFAPKRTGVPSWEYANTKWGVLLNYEDPTQRKVVDCTSKRFPTVLSLIEAGPAAWKTLEAQNKKWLKRAPKSLPLSKLKLISPLPRPTSLRDFLTFEEHSSWAWKQRGLALPSEWYEMPIFYKGNHRTFFGHGDVIPWPSYTKKLDYELELAMVVGRGGKDISKEKAWGHIFGYAVLNDWSARDIQAKEMLCRLGPAKGKDFATSLGPCIVTHAEIGGRLREEGLTMEAFINGELWSKGISSTAKWNFADMIAHVSQDEIIYPGDVYGSGTVGRGCGLELDRWIKPGDEVRLKIDGLGDLINTIGE